MQKNIILFENTHMFLKMLKICENIQKKISFLNLFGYDSNLWLIYQLFRVLGKSM